MLMLWIPFNICFVKVVGNPIFKLYIVPCRKTRAFGFHLGGFSMPLGGVIFISVFILLFGCLLLVLAKLTGQKNKKFDAVKSESYECGLPVQEKRDTKISVKFYLTAILFIIFDIEIIFMYPWAATYRDFLSSGQGLSALVAMMIFIGIFVYGLFWEVKSKALEWD